MGIAGMVLGILAVVFAIIPIFGWIVSIPCLLVGLPLSIIGFTQNRKRRQGYGMSLAGIVTNLLAIIVVILWVVLFVASSEPVDEDFSYGGEPVPLMPIIFDPFNHIPVGATYDGDYYSIPPTSGPHWESN